MSVFEGRVTGRLGGSIAQWDLPAVENAHSARVRMDTDAMKRVVLRQVAEPVPAERLLVGAERVYDVVSESGFDDLAPLAAQLRKQIADLRMEVQHASEEIRRLHHAIEQA